MPSPVSPQRQRQIELRRTVRRRPAETAAPVPEVAVCPVRCVLPGEHHLEERAVRQAAHRLEQFDHLLEGNILMLLCGQGLRLDLPEQFAHRGRAGQIQAQRQRVDEEADQVFDLRPSAVGHRRADDHILLARQPCQQRRPGSQQGHEQRGAVAPAQILQSGRQLLIQHQLRKGSGIVLLRRTGMIGRQLQQRRGSGQGRSSSRRPVAAGCSPSIHCRCQTA